MKENDNIRNCLREAIRQEETARPTMPSDLNARMMRRMEQETVRKQGGKRLRKLWPWIAAACVAAFIVVYTAPPEKVGHEGHGDRYTDPETWVSVPVPMTLDNTDIPAKAKPEKEIKAKQIAHKVLKTNRHTTYEKKEKSEAKGQKTLTAECQQEVLTAECQQDKECDLAMAEKPTEDPKPRTISESDLPITRPENLKYTKEEIALMKRQAAEAYIKWMKLELEIAKYNIEQTANIK
ncbi:MAG: hypothetical protein ACI3YT_07585 [Prevotella sp.]